MPTIDRRPRARIGTTDKSFQSESDVRDAVSALRELHNGDVDAAEKSSEWRELRPRVARWVLATAKHKPQSDVEVWGLRMAAIYLRSPHLLWALPSEIEP